MPLSSKILSPHLFTLIFFLIIRWSQDLLTCDHAENVACLKKPVVTETLVNHHGYLEHIITPQPHAQVPDFSVDYDLRGAKAYGRDSIYASGNFDYSHGGYKRDDSRLFHTSPNHPGYASYYRYQPGKYVSHPFDKYTHGYGNYKVGIRNHYQHRGIEYGNQGSFGTHPPSHYSSPVPAHVTYQPRFVKMPNRLEIKPLPEYHMESNGQMMQLESNMPMMPSGPNVPSDSSMSIPMMSFDSISMRQVRDSDMEEPQGQEELATPEVGQYSTASDMSSARLNADAMYGSYLLNKLMNQPNYEEYVKMPNGQWVTLENMMRLRNE